MVLPRTNALVGACLESPERGVIEFESDWSVRSLPLVSLSNGVSWHNLEPVPPFRYGLECGYFASADGRLVFVLDPARHPEIDASGASVYLAGEFNQWAGAGDAAWRLSATMLGGRRVLAWIGDAERLGAWGKRGALFKFVTGDGHWLSVPMDASNVAQDGAGNVNLRYSPDRTGGHLFQFILSEPLDLADLPEVRWSDHAESRTVSLVPGAFFFQLGSDLPLGAIAKGKETVFRLFAPRALTVELCLCERLEECDEPHRYVLSRRTDKHGRAGVWEITLARNLHGWFYWYSVSGRVDAQGLFDPRQRILDPYALATLGREGPGIILDRAWEGKGDRDFKTPAWQDLVIAEAHVRDLVARAPVDLDARERRGFSGLTKWVESDDFYLSRLGVNCVELQPVQENDAQSPEEYHWGYMTCNFFAPESGYAMDPAAASGVRELQQLVAAFHRKGIAVLLDVVYNHVGVPAHLMFLDKLYYFHQDADGNLSNWSGCGNDLRADAAMVKRLIIDSCRHLIETYGIDGFRFDLADLIGCETLIEIEAALKRTKSDVVLIAEPWSFRGHIAVELRDTGWASWNDGYRNFIREYVRGRSNREAFEYFLRGSPWHYAKWPSQTVNYAASHDDRAWLDMITENANFDGTHPTVNDRLRTHLMIAVLMSSIGIPMLSAGQDFLRTKRGVNNTYQRGDLNALDYQGLARYPGTHAYFAAWIAFRRSPSGRLLRHYSRASEGFFRFYWAPDSLAGAVLYNADCSQGSERLLLVLNPGMQDAFVPLGDVAAADWRQLADHEHFLCESADEKGQAPAASHFVPALGLGLWTCAGQGARAGSG